MMLRQELSRYISLVEPALSCALNSLPMPELLQTSMSYSLTAGGKRLRPCMCLAACETVGGNAADAIPAACALEMIHTYSLIHDDLPAMDNDDMRRGKPSNHKMFGEANALLAGDGLLSLAFFELSACRNTDAIQAVARASFDMVSGQSLDLNNAAMDETVLLETHRNKTGAMFLGAVRSGALIGGASKNDLETLSAFAEAYGLLFQITDDILDATGNEALMGKTLGKDAAENKATFVTLFGLENAAKRASDAASRALSALDRLSASSVFFRELTQDTLTRSH